MHTTLANIIRNLLLEAGHVHFIQYSNSDVGKGDIVERIRVFHHDEEGGAVETVLTRDSLLSDLECLFTDSADESQEDANWNDPVECQ